MRYGARRTRQTVYLLFAVFLTSFGIALWQTAGNTFELPVYGATTLLALVHVGRQPPKPVTILMPSALVLLVTLIAGLN